MAGDTTITITGNLTADPELRYTPSGLPVTHFRVASTSRVYDAGTGHWRDGQSMFMTCTAWRALAENVAETLRRGMRVIVTGRLKQRSYEGADGSRRTVWEIEADDVGRSLRSTVGGAARPDSRPAGPTPPSDPWADPAPAGRPDDAKTARAIDPWGDWSGPDGAPPF